MPRNHSTSQRRQFKSHIHENLRGITRLEKKTEEKTFRHNTIDVINILSSCGKKITLQLEVSLYFCCAFEYLFLFLIKY